MILGLLLALFVVMQSLALGARTVSTLGAWFEILEGLAVVALLAFGVMLWWFRVSRLPAREFQIRAANGETSWIVSNHRETRRAIESITFGGASRLPAVFLMDVRNGQIRFIEPPEQHPIVEIAASAIRDIEVGRTYGFGGASDCLVVKVNSPGGAIDLPMVLQRENPPHFFTQGSEALARSKAQLVGHLTAAPSRE